MERKYFKVNEFGAVGDGKTRATEAIQHAILAANVELPQAFYLQTKVSK
jgi:polygalacturonase